MGQHGGARIGAGKPKGKKAPHTIESEQIRKRLIDAVAKEFGPLLQAQLDLALGHYYEEVRETASGEVKRVYFKSPDGNSLRYLFDQGAGKAKESIEHSSNPDHPVLPASVAKMTDEQIDEYLKNRMNGSTKGKRSK